jgi:hypothetical protein
VGPRGKAVYLCLPHAGTKLNISHCDPSLARCRQRIERTTRNREAAKVRTAKKKELFEKIDREIEEA